MFVRMYYRERVVRQALMAGISMTIIGDGWDEKLTEEYHNLVLKPSVSFHDVFLWMDRAKITLMVLPWFKAGTHERFFNALLHGSCPLTDPSTWLLEHFPENDAACYYSLEHLEELPERLITLLKEDARRSEIVCRGASIVRENYTSKQVMKRIIEILREVGYV